MKHLFYLVVCIIFITNSTYAQTNIANDYVVISTAGLSETTTYTDALDAANWEPFRLQNSRIHLSFENGFSIELKSAVELLNLGYPINIAEYRIENPLGYSLPVMKLLPGNVVGMESTCNNPMKKQY